MRTNAQFVTASLDGAFIAADNRGESRLVSRADGTFIDLGTLPGILGPDNRPTGISADGSVVVGSSGGGIERRPFIWTEPTQMLPLPGVTRTSIGEAFGVSGDGDRAVGWSSDDGVPVAVYWDVSGQTVTRLPDLAGGDDESRATGISADGTTVVGWGTSERGQEAFRWKQGEGIIGLGELPGYLNRSEALDASADGSIVVGWSSCSFTGCGGDVPFIWDAGNGMRWLGQALEDDYGLDLTGWSLGISVFISDDGRKLAGKGALNGVGAGWYVDLDAIEANVVLGDMNGDGALDAFDVATFELALADSAVAPAEYGAQYPELDPDERGDINQDGVLDAFDVSAFEQLLAGGGATVPEPATALVLAFGGGATLALRRRR